MAKPIIGPITLNRLREVLAYDPKTGIFIWRARPWRGSQIKVGQIAGCLMLGYRGIKIDKHLYRAHRLAWLLTTSRWPSDQIDHVNGIRDDNRFVNLREASDAMNKQNLRGPHRDATTGFLGVSMDPKRFKKKFRARIQADGKKINLGEFVTAKEAYAVYLAAKRKLHRGCII